MFGSVLPSGDRAPRLRSGGRPVRIHRCALVVACAVIAWVGCSSNGDDEPTRASPGDACDGSRPLVCGSLAKAGTRADVILFCKAGRYETALDCAPGGNGLTNRCFAGGNDTVVDCFDEPKAGQVTRCQVKGSGSAITSACTVGSR